ncbi:conserved oligomeric Golgi complex subunit 5 [Parasteatoda tepidariorum]|uniref:conserved oligomeric Golgi complex subunit 5 n=1 Tax=Parasteatoda tepidariorum TaxID=114398 RepID=UPI00077FBBD5|nr:conserved oligomeric Golgi complex subunit 5 [Parasteatoda tepidariorum]
MQLTNITGLEEFESNELYKQFLAEDFDLKAVTFSVVQSAAVAEQLAKLSAGISLLDKALHHQVSSHYEDLLYQATEIETLESILLVVHHKIASLLSSADKLRSKVVEPYEEIASLTRKLQRLHVVCDLLRRIIRIVRVSKRLKSHLSKEPKEFSKASNCITELESILKEVDLTGLSVIESEIQYFKEAKVLVQSELK